jgi:hypothetical protein
MLGSGRGGTDVDGGLPGRVGLWSLLGPKVLFSVNAKVVNVELMGGDAVQCAGVADGGGFRLGCTGDDVQRIR